MQAGAIDCGIGVTGERVFSVPEVADAITRR
jgi:hypothetical protein